jgi:thiol-disulfide isomerase/thioredoxin
MDYKSKYLKYKFKYNNLKETLNNKNIQSGGNENTDKKELILFKTEWCGHCKNFKPVWNNIKTMYENKYTFTEYDGDNDKKEVQNYKVKGFPTLYIRSEDIIDEYLGPRDINSLSIFLENHN